MRLNLPKMSKGSAPELDIALDRVEAGLVAVYPLSVDFVNAASGAQSRYLPDGRGLDVRLFVYVKTDATANAVTIYPFGTQLIDAAASVALAARGDSVKLIFDTANQTWWSV